MTITTRHALATLILASALTAAAAAPLAAQDKPPAAPPPPTVPVRVEVVFSRFQGEKKVASQPYILMPTASPSGGYVNLRIGFDVPVGTKTTTRLPEGGREGSSVTSPQYQNVGTNIDCQVTSQADGRFRVMVNATDSSIFNPDSPQTAGKPSDTSVIRTFQASNTLTMRDGQTMLLITATDKVTGEIVKIEVMFNVVK